MLAAFPEIGTDGKGASAARAGVLPAWPTALSRVGEWGKNRLLAAYVEDAFGASSTQPPPPELGHVPSHDSHFDADRWRARAHRRVFRSERARRDGRRRSRCRVRLDRRVVRGVEPLRHALALLVEQRSG